MAVSTDTHTRDACACRYCASEGAWRDAFRAYGGMLQCRVPPTRATYQAMITACKHAKPPNSAAAVAVLAEMRRRGQPIPASLFNRVIDACRLTGSWRRALTVFQAMVEAGCTPTTATYDTLGQACAKARIEDAPDVYVSCWIAGGGGGGSSVLVRMCGRYAMGVFVTVFMSPPPPLFFFMICVLL